MLRIYEITILLIATLVVFSCGTRMRTVALSDVCREPSDNAVKVEGYFRLPQVSDWIGDDYGSGQYRLLLVEKLDGGGSFVTATVSATGSHERNHIDALPASYTYDDVRINTDSGRTVSARERVAVTGRVQKDSNPCILRIERIDTLPL
ncbi:MAG TPA: hypothetical protein PLP21_00125 [Pyrinomonadaceae bacterium]|nr:hypothetical protein [Acidobacteriota bacterium]HQZ94685.1 hypothetical protein [Pyrinomonadaceae bacterium]